MYSPQSWVLWKGNQKKAIAYRKVHQRHVGYSPNRERSSGQIRIKLNFLAIKENAMSASKTLKEHHPTVKHGGKYGGLMGDT